MEIRNAILEDCAACESLCNTPELKTIEGETISKSYLEKHLGKGSIFLVAKTSKIVGFILGEFMKGDLVFLHFIAVDKNARNKGAGSELMKRFITECKSQNKDYLLLYAPSMYEQTRKFYRKLGLNEGKQHTPYALKLNENKE